MMGNVKFLATKGFSYALPAVFFFPGTMQMDSRLEHYKKRPLFLNAINNKGCEDASELADGDHDMQYVSIRIICKYLIYYIIFIYICLFITTWVLSCSVAVFEDI